MLTTCRATDEWVVHNHLATLMSALALPSQQFLSAARWHARHRTLVVVLALHAVVLALFVIFAGGTSAGFLVACGLPGAFTLLACVTAWSRRGRSVCVVAGLLSSSALIVHLTDGATEAHFHFFVVIALVSLYEDWVSYAVAIGFVVLHELVLGLVDADALWRHPDHPLAWVGIRAGFVVAVAVINAARWRLDEEVRVETRDRDRFRDGFDKAAIGMALMRADGRFLRVNTRFYEALGYTPEDLVGMHAQDIAHPGDLDSFTGAIQKMLAGNIAEAQLEHRVFRADGTIIWAQTSITVVHYEQQESCLFAQLQDVTERHNATEALTTEQEFQAAVLDNLADGVVACDADGHLTLFNKSLRELHGLPEQDIPPAEWASHYDLFLADGETRMTREEIPLFRALRGERVSDLEMVIAPHGRASRRLLATGQPLIDARGQNVGAVVVMHDISERMAAEQRLAHQALHDSLTGLPNRALFLNNVDVGLSRRARNRLALAVLFVNLDRFTSINSTLGHAYGDEVLVAAGQRIRGAIREEDTVARLGGDEFAILCGDLHDENQAISLVERLLGALREPFRVAGEKRILSASIGVAFCGEWPASAGELLRNADVAMDRAKKAGRDRFEVFDETMRDRVIARLTLEAELREGLAGGQFGAYYQPIVDLSGQLVGFEALMRWQHPERGLVAPLDFIPVAEETGLIVQLGEAILLEATSQTALWNEQLPDLQVSVNLSTRQLTTGNIVAVVSRALAGSGLRAQNLCLEITESAVIEQPTQAIETLHRLKRLGVRLAMDDFGTGYTSLSYLKLLPIDEVKIDRSFVASLGSDSRDDAIVAAVVTLGAELNLVVVAEGVESPEQVALLQRIGCPLAQGYYFGPPTPPAVAEAEHQLGVPLPPHGRTEAGKSASLRSRPSAARLARG